MALDFSTVEIGGEVSQQVCEEHIGMTYADDATGYSLGLLKLMDEVRRYMRDKHHREITVRAVKGQLLILTDGEAAKYNPKRFADGLRLIRRAHRRMLAIDVSKLTPEERVKYGRDLETQSARLTMLRKRPETIAAEVVHRATPKLFDGQQRAHGRQATENAKRRLKEG